MLRKYSVTVVSDGDQVATAYTPYLDGYIESIQYVKPVSGSYTDGVDFTITAESTGESLWVDTNVNASEVVRPRAATNSTDGAAALYAADGEPVTGRIMLLRDRIKIVLAQAGAAKAGTFVITMLETVNRFSAIKSFSRFGGDVVEDEGAPEWVPEDAKIYIDFVNDRAWTEADGEVAINTLVGEDAASTGGWNTTGYDPDDLTTDGHVMPDNLPLALIGAARTSVLAGATLRYQMKSISAPPAAAEANLLLLSADGNNAIQLIIQSNGVGETYMEAYSWGGTFDVTVDDVVTLGELGVKNAVAWTITGTRCEVAANGNASIIDGDLDGDDRPPGALTVVVIDTSPKAATQTITIYDPLPDTDGLSELSEVA